MPKFTVKATDSTGKGKILSVEGPNENAVRTGVTKKGYIVQVVELVAEDDIKIGQGGDVVPVQNKAPNICPSCGGQNCQRKEMIFNAGTSDMNIISNTVGRTTNTGDPMGLNGSLSHSSTTESTGLQQTRIAQMAAPPTKMGMPKYLYAMLIIPPLWIFLLIAYVFYHFKYKKYNELVPDLQNKWRLEWMCLTCGNVYIPKRGI